MRRSARCARSGRSSIERQPAAALRRRRARGGGRGAAGQRRTPAARDARGGAVPVGSPHHRRRARLGPRSAGDCSGWPRCARHARRVPRPCIPPTGTASRAPSSAPSTSTRSTTSSSGSCGRRRGAVGCRGRRLPLRRARPRRALPRRDDRRHRPQARGGRAAGERGAIPSARRGDRRRVLDLRRTRAGARCM